MIVQDSVLTNWLATAKHGETMVYARATFLPVGSKVAARLRLLAASGHVLLYRERRQSGHGDENFRYIVRRTAKQLPGTDGSLKVVGIRPLGHKPQDKRAGSCAAIAREIMPALQSMIAEEGVASRAVMAQRLGLYSETPVRVAMRALERIAA